MTTRFRWGLLLALCCGACNGDDAGDPASEPLFPDDFETRFVEARDCRTSIEHQLQNIRVFANAAAAAPYDALDPSVPYPEGAQLVKVEYSDGFCDTLAGYTAMEKLAAGARPEAGDWRFQQVDLDGNVLQDGAPSLCVSCHENSCDDGYDFTCTIK